MRRIVSLFNENDREIWPKWLFHSRFSILGQPPNTKAKRVLAALHRIGWKIKRQSGSHRVLKREGWTNFVFGFHDRDEIGPKMLTRIAKHTGLKPEDL